MDVFESIKSRRSIRSFRNEELPLNTLELLIEAAQWAPSAGNIQPWEIVIVKKPETKKKLVKAALNQTFVEEAPVIIVVCANENRSVQGYGNRGKTLYCIQDTAAAIQNLHLAAYSLGLGTCWIGAFNEDEVQKILKIPEGIRPVAIIPVGYAAEKPQPRRRRAMSNFVHNEAF